MTVEKDQFKVFLKNGVSKNGHLWQNGAFWSDKYLNQNCWKCNFKDFLFHTFFSRTHTLDTNER